MAKATSTTNYPEINDIKNDLESLKTNVIELTRHVQENGFDKTLELSEKAKKQMTVLQNKGKKQLQKVERQVKAKPAQSMAIAFAAGLVASFLLSRRG